MGSGDIKTFNSAKKFADEVIHPLIKSHNNAMLCSKIGAVDSSEAMTINPIKRTMNKYNAMKERIILLQTLITESLPTINLNGSIEQKESVLEYKRQLFKCEDFFENNSSELLIANEEKPILTEKFKKLGRYLDSIYESLQGIMSKNNLLFFGEDSMFAEDEELREKIKQENRKS